MISFIERNEEFLLAAKNSNMTSLKRWAMRLLILLSLSFSLLFPLLNISSLKILSIFRGVREFNCCHQLGWTPLHVAVIKGNTRYLRTCNGREWNGWNHMYTCTYIISRSSIVCIVYIYMKPYKQVYIVCEHAIHYNC